MSNPFAFVTCRGECGSVPLTEQQFDKELFNFGELWHCPQCGGVADLDHEKTDKAGYGVLVFYEMLEASSR